MTEMFALVLVSFVAVAPYSVVMSKTADLRIDSGGLAVLVPMPDRFGTLHGRSVAFQDCA